MYSGAADLDGEGEGVIAEACRRGWFRRAGDLTEGHGAVPFVGAVAEGEGVSECDSSTIDGLVGVLIGGRFTVGECTYKRLCTCSNMAQKGGY